MAGGTLCCIVAVRTANLCELEELSVKLVVSSQQCHGGGEDSRQVVARGQCLEALLGIPLHRLQVYLEELEMSEAVVVRALSCKLVGQYALVSTDQMCEGKVYSMTSIRLLPDNCATILSYPPFCQAIHTPRQLPSDNKNKLLPQSPSLCDSWTTSTPKVQHSLSFSSMFPTFQLLSQTTTDEINQLPGQLSSSYTQSSTSRQLPSLAYAEHCYTSTGSICADDPVSGPPPTVSLMASPISHSESSLLKTSSTSGNIFKCRYSFPSSNTPGESCLSSDDSWQLWTEVTDPTTSYHDNVTSKCSANASLWDAACCHDYGSGVPLPPKKFPNLSCDQSALSDTPSKPSTISSTSITYTPSILHGPLTQACKSQSCNFQTPSQHPEPISCNLLTLSQHPVPVSCNLPTPHQHPVSLSCNSAAHSPMFYSHAALPPVASSDSLSLALFSDPSTLSSCSCVLVEDDESSVPLREAVRTPSLASDPQLPGGGGLSKISVSHDPVQTPELFSQHHESRSSPELFPVALTPVIPKPKCVSRIALLRTTRSNLASDVL